MATKMKNSFFWNLMGSRGMVTVLDYLIDNAPLQFSIDSIVLSTSISERTIRTCMQDLVASDMVTVSICKYNKKLYSLNHENLAVQALLKLNKHLSGALDEGCFYA